MENNFDRQYPFISEDIQANRMGSLLYRKSERKSIAIKKGVWEIIKHMDGTHSVQDIYALLNASYQVDMPTLHSFLLDLQKRRIVAFSLEPNYRPIESVDYSYPEIVTVILTDKCNLRCTYCFGDYKVENSLSLSMEQVIDLFKQLHEIGVRTIELTGGEPLFHPQFKQILKAAYDYFEYISLLSNGTLFKDDIFEMIVQQKERTQIRISIEGMSDATSRLIRQVNNTCEKSLNAIERMVNAGIRVAVTYMMLYENRLELEPFCEYMRNLGLKNIVISAPEGIGRGCSQLFPDGKMISDRTSPYYQEILRIYNDISLRYRDIMRYNNEIENNPKMDLLPNCGAGWKNVSIKPNGDVLACQIITKSIRLGNTFRQPIKAIFTQNHAVDFLSAIRYSPDRSLACLECEYVSFCGKCTMKIMLANRERLKKNQPLCNTAIINNLTAEIIDKYLGYEQ